MGRCIKIPPQSCKTLYIIFWLTLRKVFESWPAFYIHKMLALRERVSKFC